MYFNMDWEIAIAPRLQDGSWGDARKLALLESCEVHSSVDLLADTCTIKLPGAAYGKALRSNNKPVEQQVKRGDKVTVKLGYDKERKPLDFRTEFEGYLLNVATDDNSLTLNCEDALYLMRVAVKDKSFKAVTTKALAEYLLQESKQDIELNCKLTIGWSKYVIHQATAYDVLKKLQEETKGNIYMKWLEDKGKWQLNIHPPYTEPHGYVAYSFQQNIESSDLKYVSAVDKKIEITIERITPDGKVHKEKYGTTGGDSETMKRGTMDKESAAGLAKREWLLRMTDGYEGSLTAWLNPRAEPGMSVDVKDADYEYKDGKYYCTAVTTTFSSSGGVRKVQLGIKVGGNG